MGKLMFRTFVGFMAGLVAWAVCEPFAPGANQRMTGWEVIFILTLGAVIGGAVGGLNGFLRGGNRHTIRGVALGVLFGAIGATFGASIGGGLSSAIFGNWNSGNASLALMVPRTFAIAPIGLCLGAGIGAASLSSKSIRNGALGGVLAGITAGLLFDPLGIVLAPFVLAMKHVPPGQSAEIGEASRAVTALLIGGAIALFIGIVEQITKTAWLRLSVGRNEGKEWVIDSPQTMIGRDERAHVPLFGDPAVAPFHAMIAKQGGQYFLADSGSPSGTRINNQPIQGQVPLFHGAVIGIGHFNLEFLMKHGQAPVRGPEAYIGQAYPIGHAAVQGGYQPQPVPVQAMQPMQPMQPMPGYGQPTMAMPQQMQQPMPQQMQQTQAYPGPMAAPAGSGFALLAMDGPIAGQRYPVGGTIELGRESASIPMSYDTQASRRHASVAPGPMGLMVTDLNSTNGTFVNGQRVSSQAVRMGDILKIGATSFRVEAT